MHIAPYLSYFVGFGLKPSIHDFAVTLLLNYGTFCCFCSKAHTVLDGFSPYLAQMITSIRGRGTHNDFWPWYIYSRSFSCDFAIKLLKYGTSCHVRSTVLDEFFPYLTQIITTMREYVHICSNGILGIGSGNGLVLSSNKPLLEPMWTRDYCHPSLCNFIEIAGFAGKSHYFKFLIILMHLPWDSELKQPQATSIRFRMAS